MTELMVKNTLEELKSENNNLIKDLNLTLKLLETYRSCLICFTKNCKCLENEENKTKFDKLEDYFNKVNDRISVKLKDQIQDGVNHEQSGQQSDNGPEQKSKQTKSHLQSIDGSGEMVDNSVEEFAKDNRNKSLDEEVVNNDENNEKVVRKSCNQSKGWRRNRFAKNIITKKFVCQYCDKSFGDNYHLVRHIRGCHTLEKPYKCLKCDKRFAISEGLSQHVKVNHKDYHMFKCRHESCDFETIIEERLTTHLAKHKIIRQFECDVCHKSYLTKYELKYHKQKIHRIFEPKVRKSTKSKGLIESVAITDPQIDLSDRKVVISCHDSYVSYDSVDQSQTFDSEGVDQSITIGDQSEGQTQRPILSGTELKKRLKPRKYRNRIGVTEDIVCQEMGCGKRFLSEYNLRKHMRTVHSDIRPFLCEWPGCESAFKTRESMNCHLAAHRNERNFHCDVKGCEKRFNTRQEVHQHKRSHGIKKIERYPCSWPACGVLCQSAQALTEHVNRHQNVKPFRCDYVECDKTYFTAYELRQHVMKVHDKSESFSCDYNDCAMSFLNKRDLAKHRRLHEDVAKFVCSWPECSHTFNTSRDLSDHMNRHLDIKANKCNFVGCDRSYFKKAHLNRHIKQCHS